jgi:hypothetical protein
MSTEQSALEILDAVTRRHVENAAAALRDEFAGIFSQETISRYIAESVDKLGETKVNASSLCSPTASPASG